MIWSMIRQRLGQWIGAALIVAIAGGLFWMAAKHAERADGPSPGTALGEAMSEAARHAHARSLRITVLEKHLSGAGAPQLQFPSPHH
jgi:hypothetical protein